MFFFLWKEGGHGPKLWSSGERVYKLKKYESLKGIPQCLTLSMLEQFFQENSFCSADLLVSFLLTKL